jgi:hypothetical protein
LAADQRGT